MKLLTNHLVLAPDASIDLQMHTTNSDGTWTPVKYRAELSRNLLERMGIQVK